MRTAVLVVGIALTLWALFSIVRTMLIPNASTGLLTRVVNSVVYWFARAPLRLLHSYARQDQWLAGFAPVEVMLQLILYVVIFIFALGLMVFGFGQLTLWQSWFQAGATFTTLGIVEPVAHGSSVAARVAAFLGLVVIAVFIGYLMGTYSAYTSREAGMARLDMLAGQPAWGPQILVRGHLLGLPLDELPSANVWLDWITNLRMNHQINGALATFRSTSSARHWSTTMLAVLDAAALQLALNPNPPDPHLIELITQGAETTVAIHLTSGQRSMHLTSWQLESQALNALRATTATAVDPMPTRLEFDDAIAEMRQAGLDMPADIDLVWCRFANLRSIYVRGAVRLARKYHAVPAPWSGARTPSVPVQWPSRAGLEPHSAG